MRIKSGYYSRTKMNELLSSRNTQHRLSVLRACHRLDLLSKDPSPIIRAVASAAIVKFNQRRVGNG